jgi:hypothetical protein
MSDVAAIFLQFKIFIVNLLSCKIKILQIDERIEFQLSIRSHTSIQFHLSCPYILQHNELVEKKHPHAVELNLGTMFHAKTLKCIGLTSLKMLHLL